LDGKVRINFDFNAFLCHPVNDPSFSAEGIIPTKAEKMAGITFELMTKKLLNLKEVFDRLDPEKFGIVMGDALLLLMDKIVSEVAKKYMPRVWENLPQEAKDEFVVLADRECPAFITAFMRDMVDHIYEVLDIRTMAIDACVRNKPLVNKIFLECGDKVSLQEGRSFLLYMGSNARIIGVYFYS
jgi:hypothetical protein